MSNLYTSSGGMSHDPQATPSARPRRRRRAVGSHNSSHKQQQQLSSSLDASQHSACSVLSVSLKGMDHTITTGSPLRRRKRAVWIGRIVFVGLLILVAAMLGYGSYRFLSASELDMALRQYDSMTDRVMTEALEIAKQRRQITAAMAEIFSQAFPDLSQWPNVYLQGWPSVATSLIASTNGKDIGFLPFVAAEDQEAFEDFATNYFQTSTNPVYPNGTGVSSFGPGIWAVDPSLDVYVSPDMRYHSKTTPYSAPLMHTMNNTAVLMFNLYSHPDRAMILDEMRECSERRQALFLSTGNLTSPQECAVLSPLLTVVGGETIPGALLFQPIYPHNNPTTLVGAAISTLNWQEILGDVFVDTVSHVDCVIETSMEAITYTIIDGVPTLVTKTPEQAAAMGVKPGPVGLVGSGDFHQPRHNNLKRSVLITAKGLFHHAAGCPEYTLNIYPRDGYNELYSTNNPTVAMAGAVCILIVTSMFFFIYDFFVWRESSYGDDLLHAKRQFMRYVSHEVRTPLNSVSMGLSVLKYEIAQSLGRPIPELEAEHRDLDSTKYQEPPNGDDNTTTNNQVEWFGLADDIQNSAQSAVNILNDLLNYDKIEQGTLTLDVGVIDLWGCLEEVVEEFYLPAADKELSLSVKYGTRPAKSSVVTEVPDVTSHADFCYSKVIGDSVKISQVIRNLLSNAIKFTQKGGKLVVQVTIEEEPEGMTPTQPNLVQLSDGSTISILSAGTVSIEVQDTGAGMSPEQLKALFRDGIQFNVNKLQAGQGTGLGLFISKGIVEHHHGTLVAASEGIGKGTTFTVSLPLEHVLVADDAGKDCELCTESLRSSEEPADASGSPPSSSLNVLVVDDILSNRKLLARLLTNSGHECKQAENGEIALGMVVDAMNRMEPFDAVLMDFEMPIMNGPEATKQIRAAGSDAYIVGVTGNVLPEDVRYFISCGASAVLPKPIKVADLETLWMESGTLHNR